MCVLTRRNADVDGAGSTLYFEMPNFSGFDVETGGVGTRIDAGLSAGVPVDASLHFYTTDGGLTRQDHLSLTAEGDLEQDVSNAGLAKAGCHVFGITAGGGTPRVTRSFNHLRNGRPITVSYLGTGIYVVDFGVDVRSRFYQLSLGNEAGGTPIRGGVSVTPRVGVPSALFVDSYTTSGSAIDNNFYLLVY
jgi:hypothetical protein